MPRSVACAPVTSPGEDDFDAGPVQAWLTQLVKTVQGIKQNASPGEPSRPAKKPPVPPKPSITPSAKKKLRFTPTVRTDELAKELPFQQSLEQNLRIHPVNEWPLSSNRSSATSERERPLMPKGKAKVWPRKRWSGKRGKLRDGRDPETPC